MTTNQAMDVIAWNVYIGHQADHVRDVIQEIKRSHNPELIGLMEATNLWGDLENLGYKVLHLKPRPKRPGNRPGDANIAVLVRDDLEIVDRLTMRMRTFWRGPKHGWAQDPRVYRGVKVRFEGKIWKIGVAHTPFGEQARLESRNRLVRWLKRVLPFRPTILILDANMRLPEFEETIAEPGGAEADGTGIDLAAHKNCELLVKKNLGNRGSDHPMKYYKFVAI